MYNAGVHLKTIITIYVFEFKLYIVLELEFTHFLSRGFLKYVTVSHLYIYTRLITPTLCV